MILSPSLQRVRVGERVRLLKDSHNGYILSGKNGRVTEMNSDPHYVRVDSGWHDDWVRIDNLECLEKEKERLKPIKGYDVEEVHSKLVKNNFGFPGYATYFYGYSMGKRDFANYISNFEMASLPIDIRQEFDDINSTIGEKGMEGIIFNKGRQPKGLLAIFPRGGCLSIPCLGVYPSAENRDFSLYQIMRLCSVDSFFEDKPLVISLWEGHDDLSAYEKYGFRVVGVEEGFYGTGDSRLTLRYDANEESTGEHIAYLAGEKNG